MSDQKKELTAEEKQSIFAENTKKTYENSVQKLLDVTKNDTAVFLPNAKVMSGRTDTVQQLSPARARFALSGKTIPGVNQLLVQQQLHEAGFNGKYNGKAYDLISFDQAKEIGAFLKKDANGNSPKKFPIVMGGNFDEKTGLTRPPAYMNLYSVKDVAHPENLPVLQRKAYNPDVVFKPENGDIKEYLGKYIAATAIGAKFETSVAKAKEFKTNFENRLTEIQKTGNYLDVLKIGEEAHDVSKVLIEDYYKGKVKDNQLEQQLEQAQEKEVQKEVKKDRDYEMSMG